MRKYGIWIIAILTIVIGSLAFAKTVVKDEETFWRATAEACDGKSIGAKCEVEFIGGKIGFGICVEVPNSPVGGELTCKLNIPELANCRNNALGTPGSWITFGSLAGLLIFLRRKKQ